MACKSYLRAYSPTQEKWFSAKTVFNILNRDGKPQTLVKVEIASENKTLRKYEVHPIYNLQFRNRANAMARYKVRTAKNMAIQAHTVNCVRRV